MDGYFMFVQRIVAKVLRPSQVHPLLFKGANRKFKQIPWRRIEMNRQERERTPEEQAKRAARLIRKDRLRQKKIQAAGIDFEYDGLESALPAQSKKIKFSD
jgi:nucleolar protein 15